MTVYVYYRYGKRSFKKYVNLQNAIEACAGNQEGVLRAWGDAYYAALAKGYDHGYAAYAADNAMRRQAKKERAARAR